MLLGDVRMNNSVPIAAVKVEDARYSVHRTSVLLATVAAKYPATSCRRKLSRAKRGPGKEDAGWSAKTSSMLQSNPP